MSNRYFKRSWEESRGDHLDSWGSSTYFFEVDSSGRVVRQLEQYANGRTLSYDRQGPEDADGMLAAEMGVEDGSEWERYEIVAEEFEEVWRGRLNDIS